MYLLITSHRLGFHWLTAMHSAVSLLCVVLFVTNCMNTENDVLLHVSKPVFSCVSVVKDELAI